MADEKGGGDGGRVLQCGWGWSVSGQRRCAEKGGRGKVHEERRGIVAGRGGRRPTGEPYRLLSQQGLGQGPNGTTETMS